MKKTLIILFLASLSLFGNSQSFSKANVKEMLQGCWMQNTDSNSVMCIQNDVVEHYYKGKLKNRNTLKYDFPKSANNFLTLKNAYDFSSPNITTDFKIIEYDSLNESSTNFIIYIDNENMELGFETGRIAFKRIKE